MWQITVELRFPFYYNVIIFLQETKFKDYLCVRNGVWMTRKLVPVRVSTRALLHVSHSTVLGRNAGHVARRAAGEFKVPVYRQNESGHRKLSRRIWKLISTFAEPHIYKFLRLPWPETSSRPGILVIVSICSDKNVLYYATKQGCSRSGSWFCQPGYFIFVV